MQNKNKNMLDLPVECISLNNFIFLQECVLPQNANNANGATVRETQD